MPNDPSPVRATGALHGIDSFQPNSPSLSQQPHEAQQRRGAQSLYGRGRSSSVSPSLHQQRGRTRTREADRTMPTPDTLPTGETNTNPSSGPASTPSFMSDMEARQRQLMENQYQMQMGMEERQATMLQIKSAADMTKLMSDTVTEITKGFMDSARKVMQEGGEAMKLR
ncbi:hypothetical protein SAMN03159488_02487 [Pseudomonas sp. NFIX10]|uniref:type III effector n=1 Tax=unclassified Pseudomonas TaxID=196821 RepID=UPI0008F250F7|nr:MULTISPECIES: type III effector [unclassified Pseudomonas]SFB22806.1 hypothetical protein SAMN03159488_02487 [Pseudomonas sp. NFIX10]SFF10785.1 hypothetical protein SAMN03159367_03122 [Pseudomonas sp. NFACC06-1]